MTSLTIRQRKRDGFVTNTTILAGEDFGHAEFCRSPLDTNKNIGVTQFTTIPHGVLLV
jgi:hypothetical protein